MQEHSAYLCDLPQGGFNDHEMLEEQRRRLLAKSRRTLTLSVGRGMLTLFTAHPAITQVTNHGRRIEKADIEERK